MIQFFIVRFPLVYIPLPSFPLAWVIVKPSKVVPSRGESEITVDKSSFPRIMVEEAPFILLRMIFLIKGKVIVSS